MENIPKRRVLSLRIRNRLCCMESCVTEDLIANGLISPNKQNGIKYNPVKKKWNIDPLADPGIFGVPYLNTSLTARD